MKRLFYKRKLILFALFVLSVTNMLNALGFVKAVGTKIVDNQNNELILRGIGTGNWFLQEGYMMGTNGATNGTQWHFKQKMIATFGVEKTNEFYTRWWDNHFRKIDVDSMAKWGFNSVRVAMHYKMFTLPIEEEPVQGVDTWFESGFVRIDQLLEWCESNKIYLILDMHGCPGGQGSDSNISDYDVSKPSLWESDENKRKLVALWKKLAQRYANCSWIAGYDLINEPKWDALKTNANKDLWDMQLRIVQAIREVDPNHLLFLAGNDYGNNYTGLPDISTWGGNIALSFHKYWTYNRDNAIDWIINLGNQHNVPVWLGETGENSNTWFTDIIRLCESKKVGWSFWPVKKMGLNNILRSKTNTDYTDLLSAWRNNTAVNTVKAFDGLMKFAEDHKFENCNIQYDVIDAMLKRPHSNDTKAFVRKNIDQEIFAVDYDLGPVGYAYFDNDDATYQGSGEAFTRWNEGRLYRNDGVDIQECTDVITNGYAVAWIDDAEWLNFSIDVPASKIYNIEFRYSAQSSGARVYVEVNGRRASKSLVLQATGGWSVWKTATLNDVLIPQGSVKLKIVFEKAGLNLNYFKLTGAKEVSEQPFELLNAATHTINDEVTLDFNKKIDAIFTNSLQVFVDGTPAAFTTISPDPLNNQRAKGTLNTALLKNSVITLSNEVQSCKSGNYLLEKFYSVSVLNNIVQHFNIPSLIEAENYAVNQGFVFQTCTDTGAGQYAGYTNTGDYLDYIVNAPATDVYNIEVRASVNSTSARLAFYNLSDNNNQVGSVTMNRTGGWQNWAGFKTTIQLKKGKNVIRIQALTDGFNLNWVQLTKTAETALKNITDNDFVQIIQNQFNNNLQINFSKPTSANISVFSPNAFEIYRTKSNNQTSIILPLTNQISKLVLVKIQSSENSVCRKVLLN